MRKFDLDLLIGKEVAVNCKTEKEANDFLKYLDSKNIKWYGGFDTFKMVSYDYGKYKENTCFCLVFDSLQYSPLLFYKNEGFEIFSLDELVIKEEPKNNFKDYGFEADFEGEILKEVGDYYVGYFISGDNIIHSCQWNSLGVGYSPHNINKEYDLKSIKKEWYLDNDNFEAYKGKLITNKYKDIRKIEYIYCNCVDVGIENIYHKDLISDGWQLVTKEDIKQLIFDGDK